MAQNFEHKFGEKLPGNKLLLIEQIIRALCYQEDEAKVLDAKLQKADILIAALRKALLEYDR